MIAGLPISAWILLLCSVGLGLAIEVHFFARARGRYDRDASAPPAQD